MSRLAVQADFWASLTALAIHRDHFVRHNADQFIRAIFAPPDFDFGL